MSDAHSGNGYDFRGEVQRLDARVNDWDKILNVEVGRLLGEVITLDARTAQLSADFAAVRQVVFQLKDEVREGKREILAAIASLRAA